MTIMRDWSIDDRGFAALRARRVAEALRKFPGAMMRVIDVWRERQRQRRELGFLCARDLRDADALRDAVSEEARKWPWQQ